MSNWLTLPLHFDFESFQAFLASFGAVMGSRIESIATRREAYSSPIECAHLDDDFKKLDEDITEKLTRVFPPVVIGQMRQSLVGYRHFADLALPEIAGLLWAQTQCEAWLYGDLSNKYYREHFVHPLAVAYIGAEILGRSKMFRRVVDDTFAPQDEAGPLARFWRHMQIERKQQQGDNPNGLGETLKAEIIWAAWYVAAVCHDMAQSYDLVNMVDREFVHVRWWGLERTPPHDLTEHLDGHLWWEYLRWAVRKKHAAAKKEPLDPHVAALAGMGSADGRAAWHVLQQHCRRNHSTICALWIQILGEDVARRVQGSPETSWLMRLVFELAAAAVLTHDWVDASDVYGVERFCDPQGNPLGHILLSADLLECWARPYRLPRPSHGSNPHQVACSEYVYPFKGVSVRPATSTDGDAAEVVITRHAADGKVVRELCSAKATGEKCPKCTDSSPSCPPYTKQHEALINDTLERDYPKEKRCHLIHFEQQLRSFLDRQCCWSKPAPSPLKPARKRTDKEERVIFKYD